MKKNIVFLFNEWANESFIVKFIISKLGTTIGIFIILFSVTMYFVIFKLEVLEKAGSNILRIFSFLGSSVQKKQISKSVRGEILKVTKELSKEVDGIIPYDMRIQWVKDIDKETFIQNNQIIVKMDYKNNPIKNKVYALHQYVEHGLLAKTKVYFDSDVIKSLDITVVRKLLIMLLDNDALTYFDNKYLKEYIEDENIKHIFYKLANLDNSGLLTAIFIRELIEKSQLLVGEAPDECMKIESRQLLGFLYKIAIKEPGEDVPLQFNSEYFNIGVIIIAKEYKLKQRGIQPYMNRAKTNLDEGVTTIYLIADTEEKKEIAQLIAENFKKGNDAVKKVREFRYYRKLNNRRRKQGICIAIYTSDIDAIKELQEELSENN